MTDHNDIERLIASLASGEAVDWDAARDRATTAEDRAQIDALRGIEQIAAFSHAQWEPFAPLFDGSGAAETSAAEPDAALLAAPQPGHRVGAYELEAPIGEGGMGTVWLARRSDGRFEAQAAVKLLHHARIGRDGLARFKREGEILARLRHANIAQLMDAGVATGGQPYLVLEHVDGVAIDRYCDQHGLDIRQRITLFLDVLRAVAHAQANLVLHRDLKPSNVLVDKNGHVKLLDFGIAKLLEGDGIAAAETELTQRAGHAFTPEYAAPEQLRGEPVTTATDVYAAGVLLYLLVTGKHPTTIVHGSAVERMEAILESTPKPASEAVTVLVPPAGDGNGGAAAARSTPAAGRPGPRWRRELQGDLDNILAKALKKDPDERYASAAAFADDLRRYLNQEPVTARADTITYRIGKFVRRHRAGVASAVTVFVLLLSLTSIAITQLYEARRQRDQARAQTRRAEGFNNIATSLLSQVGPGGRALSPEELLDRAVAEVQSTYANDPPFLVDLLILLSGRYMDLSKHSKEHATLVQAEEIARRVGDPALVFDVQVNTVETELALGRRAEARRRIDEARGLLPSLEEPPSLHAYLRAEAEVAKAEGDIPAAIEYLEKGRQLLEDEGRTGTNSYDGILSVLRLHYALAGNLEEAHAYALRMIDNRKRHHREETAGGTTARAVLATSFASVGEVERGRTLFEAAFPELATLSPGKPTSMLTLGWLYADILSREERHDTALSLFRESVATVADGGNRLNLIRARLAFARALLRAGQWSEADSVLGMAVAGIQSDEAAYRVWLTEADRLRAELYLARGEVEAASQEVNAALQRIGYPENRQALALPQAVHTLGRIQHAQRRSAESIATLRDAVTLFERDAVDPSQSADVGEALLEMAAVQRETGDLASAEKTLARALPTLRAGLGPDHRLVREAERFAVAGR